LNCRAILDEEDDKVRECARKLISFSDLSLLVSFDYCEVDSASEVRCKSVPPERDSEIVGDKNEFGGQLMGSKEVLVEVRSGVVDGCEHWYMLVGGFEQLFC
jgi:hypothetical protein